MESALSRWFVIVLAIVGPVVCVGAAQYQHVLWSTARIDNMAEEQLSDVRVLIDETVVPVGSIGAKGTRFITLPKKGDATLTIAFTVEGTPHEGCREYVESEMYHVRVSISPTFDIQCSTELGLSTRRLMILEMLPLRSHEHDPT